MRILSPMPTGSGASIVHHILDENISGYKVVPYNPWWTLAPPMLRWFSRNSADLIHTSPDYAIFVAQHGKPLIITFHGYVLDDFMRQYSSPLQWLHYRTDLHLFTRLALKRANMVTAVSQFTADLVRKDMNFIGPIRIIKNGVDIQRFVPANNVARSRNMRVLFSGNFRRAKGVWLLNKIAPLLKPGIEVVCATGLRGGNKATMAENIRLLGRIPHEEMPMLYNDVDILLMPTVREGFGLAVAEAMACGLPVVATDCSTMPELICQGKGGFLCELGDAEDFAEKINLLAVSPGLRREMGVFNRERVETLFTQERMVSEYKALFEETLDIYGSRTKN